MLFPKRRLAPGAPVIPAHLPQTAADLLARSHAFRETLSAAKQTPPSQFSWYPYHTMASLDHLSPLIQQHYPLIARALQSGPVLDVGCGDGDLACFFASLGLNVTAIDNPPTNYNWMNGIRDLRARLRVPLHIEERDVDAQFSLGDSAFGLTFLLGTLYHLKNPYYVLETLAKHSRYCLLSTRIAAVTPKKTRMEKEPLAYLLDDRETNDDASNYWIFSPTALLRLAKRSGWTVLAHVITDSKRRANPVDPDADSRMFLFLRSDLRSSPATLRLWPGWTEISEQGWAWTLKKFVIDVDSHDVTRPTAFRLGFIIPPAVASVSPVTLQCKINGKSVGKQTYKGHGPQTFSAAIPDSVDYRKTMRFEFTVKHRFRPALPDTRELGIIVPHRGKIAGISEPISFWLD
jgi:SAM-dependent methyltransferase